MNIVPDFPPPHAEVKDQLTRMLASPRFAGAANPSDFLKLVVMRKLAGKKTTGGVIAKALFKNKFVNGISPDVRVTASNLRKTLDKYYALEGKEDGVVIALPTPPSDRSIRPKDGDAYTPEFSYNRNHWIVFGVRIGYIWLSRWSYFNIVQAYTHFQEMLKKEPKSLGPTLGFIETLCNFDDRAINNPDKLDCYSTSRDLLEQLESPPADYWRLWAVRAYVESVSKNFAGAEAAFQKALQLNRAATESYLPYIHFLPYVERRDEALALAYNYLNLHMEDGIAFAQMGLFFGIFGPPESAKSYLKIALEVDPGNYCAHEFMVVLNFVLRDFPLMMHHLKLLHVLYDAESFAVLVAQLVRYEQEQGLQATIMDRLEAEFSVPSAAIVKR